MRFVELPEYPKHSFINFGSITCMEAAHELTELKFKSTGLGSLEDLKAEGVELHKHPEFRDDLSKLGTKEIRVVAGLDIGWFSTVEGQMAGCYGLSRLYHLRIDEVLDGRYWFMVKRGD